jgi:hypothetical protein
MLKNKDGSYNKFPLIIISLIILISICVIGIFIIDNLPKSILGVQNNSQLHNVEETTYFNYSGYHENYTWVTPNTTYNYSVADIKSVGGGAGGGGSGRYYTNATYIYFVGGGGGGNIISNSAAEITNVSVDSSSEINSPLQNISSVILIPFGTNTLSGLSILFLILLFPIMLIIFKSRQALIGMLIITMFIWVIGGFTYSNVILVIVIIAIIYTFMTGIFNKY